MAQTKDKAKPKTVGRPTEAPRMQEDRTPDGRNVIRNRAGDVVSLPDHDMSDWSQFSRDIIPPGWDYQWIAEKVFNWDNTQRLTEAFAHHWEPVPMERHPGVFHPDKNAKGPIRSHGQILCERRMELTLEQRRRDKLKADQQVGDAFRRAGMQIPRTITDFNHAGARANTGVSVERQGFATQTEEKYSYKIDD